MKWSLSSGTGDLENTWLVVGGDSNFLWADPHFKMIEQHKIDKCTAGITGI